MSRNVFIIVFAVIFGLIGWVQYLVDVGEVDKLESTVAELTKSQSDLQNSAAEMTGRINELTESLKNAEAAFEQTKGQTTELTESLNNAEAAKKAAEEAAEQTKGQLTELDEQLRVAQAAVGVSDQQVAQLTQAKSDLQNLKNEIAAVSERTDRRVNEANARAEGLAESFRKSTDELTTAQQEISRLQGENQSLIAQAAEKGNELDAIKLVYSNLKSQLEGEQDKLLEVTEQLSSGRTEIEQSSRELAAVVAARDNLQQALEAARSKAEKTSELEKKLQEADQEVKNRTESMNQERERVVSLEQELDSLNRGREKLMEDINIREGRIDELTREGDQARQEIEALRSEISQIAKQKDLEVQNLQNQVALIRMEGDIVYRPGSTRLSQSGTDVLDRVAAFAENHADRIISLEGHTDSVPISEDRTDRFPSNWELSAARAASAARYLIAQGVAPNRIQVVGYGQERPVADNAEEEGRRQNRRLEIRLTPLNVIER